MASGVIPRPLCPGGDPEQRFQQIMLSKTIPAGSSGWPAGFGWPRCWGRTCWIAGAGRPMADWPRTVQCVAQQGMIGYHGKRTCW